MRGIECAYFGSLVRDVELKTAKSGKPWASLLVMVDTGEEKSQLVQTAIFGEVAEKLAGSVKGTRIYIEGVLSLNQWNDKTTGEVKHGLSVAAFTCQKVGSSAIGRNRPKAAKHFEQDDTPGTNNRPSASYCAGPSVSPRERSRPGYIGADAITDDFESRGGDELQF